MDAGNMIKPMLARGELRLIGATTLDEYRKHIEKDAALERRFQQVFVGQPSVEDTIAILRGLKERYEVHHGVRIQDAALVAAAVLSRPLRHRPLPARQGHRPDRRGRQPAAHRDRLDADRDRRRRAAHPSARDRARGAGQGDRRGVARAPGALDQDLANLREQSSAMKAHWQGEKDEIAEIRSLKEQLEARRAEADRFEREGDLARAAEIRYGQLPELEQKVDDATAALEVMQMTQKMLKEEVDAEDIAEVVSKWTGVPVTRLLEGEVQKLVRMEEMLHERVVGQDEAVTAVANAIRRSRAGPVRPAPSDRLVHVPRPDRRREDRAGARAGRVPVRRRAGHGAHRHERVHGEAQRLAPHRRASRVTSATTRAASSPRRCAAGPTRSCCSTRSRRPTPTCSTCCSSCSTTGASPTARAARSTSPTWC